MKSSGGSGAAVATWPRPGYDLDIPMGEHHTGTSMADRIAQPPTEPSTRQWAAADPVTPTPAAIPAPAPPAPAPTKAPTARAPRTTRRRPDIDTTAIAALYTDGASLDEVATTHGICVATVRRRLHDAGVTPRTPGRTRAVLDLDTTALVDAYNAGASIRTIAATHGASSSAIHTRLTDAGVTMRPPLSPHATPPTPAPEPDPVPPAPPEPAVLDAAAVRRLERRGLTTGQIATELGCTVADLHRHYAKPHRRSRTA